MHGNRKRLPFRRFDPIIKVRDGMAASLYIEHSC